MKLVILERDGTISYDGADFITSAEDWTPLPGALEAIARLNHAGFHVVIATNQPGLGRGLFDVVTLNAIHAKMHKMLAAVGARVDAVFYCPHAPEEHCLCRKPLPGLFEQIGERYGMDLQGVAACGDNADHLLAGAAAGCAPHWVRTGSVAASFSHAVPEGFPPGTVAHADLGAFADALIARAAP
jgi:D-glycero-D-manno-heptose 1,7-bisphosphate phosphatase